MSKTNKKLEGFKKDLFSTDQKVVLKSLAGIKEHGDVTAVEPMIQVYNRSDGEIKKTIHGMLNQLKISKADGVIIDMALDDEFDAIRADLLSFVWNSGFQPNDRIRDIVYIGIHGDFMTAFESLTLLDTLEGPFNDADLIEAQLVIKEFMVSNRDDERIDLASKIYELLRQMDQKIAE